jgi:1-acyl-sn-glycerol-3-phosphate acyltransferase
MEEPEDLVAMKEQVYKDARPERYFDRFHERARTRDPDWVYAAVKFLTAIYSWVFFRARAIGAERVPPEGPVIIAPNHFSHMDHFFVGDPLRRSVRFMAKSQMFKPPLQWVFTHGGVFPVRRGHGDETAFETARIVLENGGCVVMYCEGGRSRTGALAERARPGIGRLALESGATVVPMAIHGSSKVRNWKKLQFPKVTVQYGRPFRFEPIAEPSREEQQAAADEVFASIKQLYAGLEQHGRKGVVARVRQERRAARRAKRAAPA